jgi:hypothetical protein
MGPPLYERLSKSSRTANESPSARLGRLACAVSIQFNVNQIVLTWFAACPKVWGLCER